jgi:hypothetical protein
MRALLLGTMLAIGLIPGATAQLAVGPVPIMSSINGIPITVSVTSWITVNSVAPNVRFWPLADISSGPRQFSKRSEEPKNSPFCD